MIVNVERVDVVERELVHVGHWFDDGTMRIRLCLREESSDRSRNAPGVEQLQGGSGTAPGRRTVGGLLGGSGTAPAEGGVSPTNCAADVERSTTAHSSTDKTLLDVFNLHFAGGNFNKPNHIVAKKRSQRTEEFAALNEALVTSSRSVAAVLVCGDFNCDPDPKHRELFPEASMSPEFANSANEDGPPFIDVGVSLGATESDSRNGFRAWLKPGQGREVRFDRILLRGGCVVEAELVGGEQVGEVGATNTTGGRGDRVPLFCSDHFGVFARVEL